MKGASPFIAFALTFLLSILIIGITLTTLNPYFQRAKVTSLIEEAIRNLYLIDKAIKEVASEGKGSQRVLDLKSSGGLYVVDNRTGTVQWILKTTYSPFKRGMVKQRGNIRIYTGGFAKVYEEGNEVVLENDVLKIGLRKPIDKQNWTGIVWDNRCWKYFNGTVFESLDDYLVFYLPFEEGVGNKTKDFSGYNNDGTLYNNPEWVDGIIGKALKFDGVNDYVEVSDSPSLRVDRDLTISVWIYPTNISKGRQSIIFKHYNNEYEVIMEPDGRISFYHGDGSWEEIEEPAGMVVTQNQWNHVVITRSMSDMTIRFYLNGNYVGSDTFTDIPLASTYPVTIGLRRGTTYYFEGIIDEVRIYNKALNETEIKWLYESTRWKFQTDFLHLKFDESFINITDYKGETLGSIFIPAIKINGKPISWYFSLKNLTIYYYDWKNQTWMKFGCNLLTGEHLPELGYDWPDFSDPRYKQQVKLKYSFLNSTHSLNLTFIITASDPFVRMIVEKNW